MSVTGGQGGQVFHTTRWSVVLKAGEASDGSEARTALELLCRDYWYPLYAFVRRKGRDPDEAADLVQAFFLRLLERALLSRADPERGRFRTYLLTALDRFLIEEWRKGAALKRGGGRRVFSFDLEQGEERYQREPESRETAEREYERRWAQTVLERALARLGEEAEAKGQQARHRALLPYVGAGGEAPYRDLAAELGMTETAVKTAVHRLRKRCRALVRDEVRQTLADPSLVDEEVRALFSALASA